jgi:low affinity Fe/Cu permease
MYHRSLSYHRTFFGRFASSTARAMGHPLAFLLAVLIIVGWAVTGPFFGFSDTWQLVINTSTTIVTFLMVFLIQNTQNRDSTAVQLKLDELIRAIEGAHNSLLDLEELEEEELERLRAAYEELARRARERGTPGLLDLDHAEGAQETSTRCPIVWAVPSTWEAAPTNDVVRPASHGVSRNRFARWPDRSSASLLGALSPTTSLSL